MPSIVDILGHIVGQGQVKHVEAKVGAISDVPMPSGKRQLMRFLSMAGYYRKFCNNFSIIAEPLPNSLAKASRLFGLIIVRSLLKSLKVLQFS